MQYWKENQMNDFSKNEETAIEFAGKMAGEYMAEIGKTDLATFTKDEWMTFLKVVYGNTCKQLGELEVPF